jgi:CMP/dCMP kinase
MIFPAIEVTGSGNSREIIVRLSSFKVCDLHSTCFRMTLHKANYHVEGEMIYRALTISREYGSGGAKIASLISKELGWKLVDKELIDEISRKGQVSPEEAEAFDERVDPWIHRITRSVWSLGVDGVSAIAPLDVFDAERAASVTKQIIDEVYRSGSCVIVGRGAQFILRGKKDVFHAFLYGSFEDRVNRIKQRVKPGTDVPALIRSMDAERLEYIRLHFKQNRLDPHFYDLMINTKDQIDKVAQIILDAMRMVS